MKKSYPQLVFADKAGKVFYFDGLAAAGMKAGRYFPLSLKNCVKLPHASEMFMLPGRLPVGIDTYSGQSVVLDVDPYSKNKEACYAVAAFIPPGYTITHHSAYEQKPDAPMLPLFAYAACFYHEGDFYVPAVRVDKGHRHDEKYLDISRVRQNVKKYTALFPKNRLVPHLANCALVNGCANAKNFFLGRFEAPVPTSPVCNAQCQGCISLQPQERPIKETQKRIDFIPSPEEISELAFFHFEHEEDPIVSFGQGCEGEPTLSGDVIEKAIHLIRQKTSKGMININSNASRPAVLDKLFSAGLNSVRVSLNSVREPYYSRYYQPKKYSLEDVKNSIRVAKKHGAFVSINYLSMPGFTDSRGEYEALVSFIKDLKVDMIQWRNLNYDPIKYFQELGLENHTDELLGMDFVIASIHKKFPGLLRGYFNPKKSKLKSLRAYLEMQH